MTQWQLNLSATIPSNAVYYLPVVMLSRCGKVKTGSRRRRLDRYLVLRRNATSLFWLVTCLTCHENSCYPSSSGRYDIISVSHDVISLTVMTSSLMRIVNTGHVSVNVCACEKKAILEIAWLCCSNASLSYHIHSVLERAVAQHTTQYALPQYTVHHCTDIIHLQRASFSCITIIQHTSIINPSNKLNPSNITLILGLSFIT
eukprot:scpid93389/ scgid31937/ 